MVKYVILTLILTILLYGCGVALAEVDREQRQTEATRIVWNQTFSMAIAPPNVIWVLKEKLICGDGRGFYIKKDGQDLCVLGAYYRENNTAIVAWPKGSSFSTTAFAHELAHALTWELYGHGDMDHNIDAIWGTGGLVDQANKALEKVGL